MAGRNNRAGSREKSYELKGNIAAFLPYHFLFSFAEGISQ
jgi:hypothetical protein